MCCWLFPGPHGSCHVHPVGWHKNTFSRRLGGRFGSGSLWLVDSAFSSIHVVDVRWAISQWSCSEWTVQLHTSPAAVMLALAHGVQTLRSKQDHFEVQALPSFKSLSLFDTLCSLSLWQKAVRSRHPRVIGVTSLGRISHGGAAAMSPPLRL